MPSPAISIGAWRSCLGNTAYVQDFGSVRIAERTSLTIMEVALWVNPELLPEISPILGSANGRIAGQGDGWALLPLGPQRWHLVSESGSAWPAKLRNLVPEDSGAVVELGEGRCVLRVDGDRSVDLLAKGISLDLDNAAFPKGQVTGTTCHRIAVIVHRVGLRTFDLHVYRGYARSLADLFQLDAMELASGSRDMPTRVPT